MRRKSTRSSAKSTPEKPKPETPPRRSRRQSKRRKKTTSESSDDSQDDTMTLKELRAASAQAKVEEPMWKVVSSSAPTGEVQKLKISLARPSTDQSPKKEGARHGSNSGTSDTDNEHFSGWARAPTLNNEESSDVQQEDPKKKDVKGKGKSKDKNKHQKSSQFSEPEVGKKSEISENVQVTPESPSIDIPVDNGENVASEVQKDSSMCNNDTECAEEKPTETPDVAKVSEVDALETIARANAETVDIQASTPTVTNDDEKSEISVEMQQNETVSDVLVEETDASENQTAKTDITEEIAETPKNIESEVTQTSVISASEKEEEVPIIVTEAAVEETLTGAENDSERNETAPESAVIEEEKPCAMTSANDEKMDLDVSETEHLRTIQEELQQEQKEPEPQRQKPKERKFKLTPPPETPAEPPQTTKRPWGTSLTGLKLIEPTLIKVDFETLRNIYPNADLLTEGEVKLETSPERRKSEHKRKQSADESERPSFKSQSSVNSSASEDGLKTEETANIIALNRKISIVDDSVGKLKAPPSPAKNPSSEVLFITNLVRPFTLKQLKELLERTGKIKEDGFWTDRIKSKCYVWYETAEEAEATRNALHGVQWPIGNGKKLIIDYGTPDDLESARNPPPPPPPPPVVEEDKTREKENEAPQVKKHEEDEQESRLKEKRRTEEHVREWDVGKTRQHRSRSTSRSRERYERKQRTRLTPSPIEDFVSKKHQKLEEPVPQKLMDDLFQKTKSMPSIYWQPLTPEEIATKQQQRLMRMAEHKRRMEETSRNRNHEFGRATSYKRRYD